MSRKSNLDHSNLYSGSRVGRLFDGLVALLQYRIQNSERELMANNQGPTVLVDGFCGMTKDGDDAKLFESLTSNLGRNPAMDLELTVA